MRRQQIPRFKAENFEKNKRMLQRLESLAAQKATTPAQLSLGWLLQKAKDLGVACLPIPGTRTLSHAVENIKSASNVLLSAQDMQMLEEIAEMAAGARESEAYMKGGMEGATQRARAKL